MAFSATRPGDPPPREVVEQDGAEEHGPEEDLEPVGVDPGHDDPLPDHPEDQRAEDGADGGAVAAGEERPPDHHGDDGPELLHLAPEGVGAGEADGLDHGDEPGGDQQSSGVEQIDTAVEQMNTVTQQTAAASEEGASTAEELSSQADALRQLVAAFTLSRRVEDTGRRGAGMAKPVRGDTPPRASEAGGANPFETDEEEAALAAF